MTVDLTSFVGVSSFDDSTIVFTYFVVVLYGEDFSMTSSAIYSGMIDIGISSGLEALGLSVSSAVAFLLSAPLDSC